MEFQGHNLYPKSNISSVAHKFQRGHLLVLGSQHKSIFGAGILSSKAASALGAGWVSLAALTHGHDKQVPDWLVEIDLTEKGKINPEKLRNYILEKKVKVLIIGPQHSNYT